MGKTVYLPHFNRDTFAFASRYGDESKPGIKTLLPLWAAVTTKIQSCHMHSTDKTQIIMGPGIPENDKHPNVLCEMVHLNYKRFGQTIIKLFTGRC